MTESKKRRSWPRFLIWILLIVVALPLLLLVGAELAARRPGVRQAIQQRLSREVAERTGLSLELQSLQLSLLHSEAVAEGIRLGVPDAPPLVTVDRLEIDLRLSSLWRPPLTLERLDEQGELDYAVILTGMDQVLRRAGVNQWHILRSIDLSGLEPGPYRFRVTVTDHHADSRRERELTFAVIESDDLVGIYGCEELELPGVLP